MRKATRNVAINRDQSDQLVGISLGYGYVYEHEHGVRGILKAFGVPDRITQDNCGAVAHKVTRTPKHLSFFPDVDGFSYLLFTDFFESGFKTHPKKDTLDRYMCYNVHGLNAKDDGNIVASWDDNEFAICVKLEEDKSNPLEEIYDAFKTHNVLIYLSKKDRLDNKSSLNIKILSRLSREFLMKMIESDNNLLVLFDEAALLIDQQGKTTATSQSTAG